jgi:hypothetical protein
MSSPNPDNTVDFGTVDPAGLPHEFIAKRTDGNVATVLATVTRIEDKVDHLTHKVDHLIGEVATLASNTAHTTTGISLVNAVQQILNTVQEIRQQV